MFLILFSSSLVFIYIPNWRNVDINCKAIYGFQKKHLTLSTMDFICHGQRGERFESILSLTRRKLTRRHIEWICWDLIWLRHPWSFTPPPTCDSRAWPLASYFCKYVHALLAHMLTYCQPFRERLMVRWWACFQGGVSTVFSFISADRVGH